MRWKAIFFDADINEKNEENKNHMYGLKTLKCPPQVKNLVVQFKNYLLNLVKNVQFRYIQNEFQDKLSSDLKAINSSNKHSHLQIKHQTLYIIVHCT